MIRKIKQDISLSDDLKNAGRVVNLGDVNAGKGLEFEALATRVGKRQKILRVMVATTGDHAVVTPKPETLTQRVE